MGFEKAFNKFAKSGTALNRGINKVIGKDIFQDINEIEPEKEYPPYESFPPYTEPEPEQWVPLKGEGKQFPLQGSVITVSENFDTCMQYRNSFKECAQYYTDRFKFKYQHCVSDFDSLLHFFPQMYAEGLDPMLQRAYGLLLPFGIFTEDMNRFADKHKSGYQKAIRSYEIMAGIEQSRNRQAENTGNTIGNSFRLQGGGFGIKGAAKGIAMAEGVNLGMKAIGKFVESQNRMTPEEKATAYAAFKQDVFFDEVFSDYSNSFLTLMQTLSDNHCIETIYTKPTKELNIMIQNLQNPMFPQNQLSESIVKLISSHPFSAECYQLLIAKYGETEEVKRITEYFMK